MFDTRNEVTDTDQINFSNSMYITPSDIVKDNKISIMSINVQSMNSKFQYLRDIVHQVEPTFLCL